MLNYSGIKLRCILVIVLFAIAQFCTQANAQNVDIKLKNTGSTLEVWLMPKADYSGIVSGMIFAISWNTAANLDLGAGSELSLVPAIPIQVGSSTLQTTITNGARKYRIYSCGGGATNAVLVKDVALKIFTITLPQTGSVTGIQFSVNNDAFLTANNNNYYFEMNGMDYTGKTINEVTLSTVEKESTNAIQLYPNPAHNIVQLVIDAPNAAEQTVEIVDVQGKKWLSTTVTLISGYNKQAIDIQSLPMGMYFLKTMNSKGVKEIISFVKQ